MPDDRALTIALVFLPFSLLSIGGGNAIFAGVQHEVVTVHGWMTSREFLEAFAVSRAIPGPAIMIVTLIGWHVAGWAGAIAASLALFVPSSLLCYGVIRLTDSHREKKWHKAVRRGLAPVGVGLTVAGAISIFRLSGGGFPAALVSASSAAVLLAFPRVPMILLLAVGAAGAIVLHQLG